MMGFAGLDLKNIKGMIPEGAFDMIKNMKPEDIKEAIQNMPPEMADMMKGMGKSEIGVQKVLYCVLVKHNKCVSNQNKLFFQTIKYRVYWCFVETTLSHEVTTI